MQAIEAQMMMRNYEGFIKPSPASGGGSLARAGAR
jgi:hypothetical protein